MKKISKFTKIFDHKMWFYDFVRFTGWIPVFLKLRLKRIYVSQQKPKDLLKGKFIICSNHNSFFDPPIIMSAIWRRRILFLAAKELYKNKHSNRFFNSIGMIKVDRENVSIDTFKKGMEALERGHTIAVFPESNVDHTTDIRKFKSGIVMMSVMCDAPILPIYIAPRISKKNRQIVVIGDKINFKNYINGSIPNIDEIHKITQILEDAELRLKQKYEVEIIKKHKNIKQEYRNIMLNNPNVGKLVNLTTVTELLVHIKNQFGSCPAVVKPNGEIATFNNLYEDVLRVASSLKDNHGNIGLFANNGYWFEIASLAIMATGNTVVCLPATLNQQQLSACCNKFDIKLLCVDQEHSKIADSTNISTKVISTLLNNSPDYAFKSIDPQDSACILLTGGTTGAPKGAIISHTALMRGMMNGCYGLNKIFNERYYCMIPLTHSFGFIRNMLCALYTGSLIYYNVNKLNLFKELSEFKPSVLITVPAIAELLLSIIKNKGKEIVGNNIHTIICGSANVSSYLPLEYAKLDIGFYPGYGMTEFANMVTGNIQPTMFPQSVGLLFPEQEAKIVEGELLLKGRNMFSGYYNSPQDNQKAFDNGWFKTGDLARMDEYGNIYILGRTNDLIVLDNGEKVSPAAIESEILKIDLVKDALVYAQRNEHNVINLVLEVTLRLEQQKNIVNPQEYLQKQIDLLNSRLLAHERINKIIIRDKDFDRTPAQKIIRKK